MIKILMFMMFLFTTSVLALEDGTYRLELTTQHAKIPFLMKVSGKGSEFSLLNGDEIITLNNLRTKKKNHLTLLIPTYQASFSLDIKGNELTGLFTKAQGSEQKVSGKLGDELFPASKRAPQDFQGKWQVSNDKKEAGILLLEQSGQKIKGSYLTPYGDYRHFSGVVDGDEFSASSFDGVYNYLITGKLADKKISAMILAHYKIALRGQRNDLVQPIDPYSLTQVEKKINFNFPDLENKMISLSDEQFKGKPLIIQIFGSWCPNCIEELNYLVPWYEQNAKRGIGIIALSFERTQNLKSAQLILKKLAAKVHLNYPMLIAGTSSADTPENKLPGLKNFKAFPTTIFLDKNHHVYKVHAGFNGPSTKEFYLAWQKDFNATVDQLLP